MGKGEDYFNRVYALSRDESERRIALAREMAERDRLGELAYAEDKVIEIGRETGLADGIEQGRAEVARGMKADGEPVEKIARYTGLSTETIAAL